MIEPFGAVRVVFSPYVDDTKPPRMVDGVVIAKDRAHLEAAIRALNDQQKEDLIVFEEVSERIKKACS